MAGGSGTCKRWQMQPNSGERWQPFVYFGLGRAWAGRRKAREAASAISTRRGLWLAAGARPGLLTQPELEFETDGIESINQRALTVFLVAYLGTAG